MNLTKCMYRAFCVDSLIFKHIKFPKENFKFSLNVNWNSSKKVPLNYYNTDVSNGNLINDPIGLTKKRLPIKKKKLRAYQAEGFQITAFSTAEEYNLEKILINLPKFTDFKPSKFNYEFINVIDAVHAEKNSETGVLGQDLFFFRDGCIVMWNLTDPDIIKILDFLKLHEENSFVKELIKNESEYLSYSVSDNINKTQIHGDSLVLSTSGDVLLEKYAVSNAMALSVHLGIYEANLEQYIDTMEPVTEKCYHRGFVFSRIVKKGMMKYKGELQELSKDESDAGEHSFEKETLKKLSLDETSDEFEISLEDNFISSSETLTASISKAPSTFFSKRGYVWELMDMNATSCGHAKLRNVILDIPGPRSLAKRNITASPTCPFFYFLDLKAGNKINMSRNEALRKMGQLFAIRHNINLNSDLLDAPDFYWDRDELETVYQTVFNYYCINKRTKVINEKINHCIELAELLSSHLNDKHHVRLEWMIIVLIMVEVAFEVCHYVERYMDIEKH